MPRIRSLFAALALLICAGTALAQQTEPARPAAGQPPVPSLMRVPDPNRPPTISLAPAVVVLRASFGQTVTQSLTLSNETSSDYAFEMIAQDVVIRDGKRTFVRAGDLEHSIAQSAVFSRTEGIVKPYTSVSVDVRFTVPAQTDIRAVVALFRGKAAPPVGQNAVAMTASLGALVTFILTDAIAVETEPLKVTAEADGSSVVISDVLRNSGKEPVVPAGVAAILDSRGKLVGKISLDPQRLLPGERLPFRAEYAGQLTSGSYKVLCSFDLGGKQVTSSGTFKIE
jgi:hypothetical protein